MATVRFSDQLKSDILRNARELFKQQEANAKASIPDGLGDKLYDKFFTADVVGKMNALPQGFLVEKENIDLDGFKNVPDTLDRNMYTTHGVSLSFASARRMPATWPEALTGAEQQYRSTRLNWNDERWDDLKQVIYDYNQRIKDVVDKKDKFVAGVENVINSFATLAPALKAWPALWDLVPDEAKERHKKIVERTKKDADDITADLNTLTAQVTFSKLTK